MPELDTQEKYNEYCNSLKEETKQLELDNIKVDWLLKGIVIGVILGTICTIIAIILIQ